MKTKLLILLSGLLLMGAVLTAPAGASSTAAPAVSSTPLSVETAHARMDTQARDKVRRILADGDGNSCYDNLVISSQYGTVVKVNACVGQVLSQSGARYVYHYAFIRCGKSASQGGGYWSDCNFGLHPWMMKENLSIAAAADAAVLHVSTWTFRSSWVCPSGTYGSLGPLWSQTHSALGDVRGFEVRNNVTDEPLFTGHSYLSNDYNGYPGNC